MKKTSPIPVEISAESFNFFLNLFYFFFCTAKIAGSIATILCRCRSRPWDESWFYICGSKKGILREIPCEDVAASPSKKQNIWRDYLILEAQSLFYPSYINFVTEF